MSHCLNSNHLCIHSIFPEEQSTSFYMYLYQHPMVKAALFWVEVAKEIQTDKLFSHLFACLRMHVNLEFYKVFQKSIIFLQAAGNILVDISFNCFITIFFILWSISGPHKHMHVNML